MTHAGRDAATLVNNTEVKDLSEAPMQVPSWPKRQATQRFEMILRDNLDNL